MAAAPGQGHEIAERTRRQERLAEAVVPHAPHHQVDALDLLQVEDGIREPRKRLLVDALGKDRRFARRPPGSCGCL